MSEKSEVDYSALLVALVTVAMTVPIIIYWGWATQIIWNWFAPVFDLPFLTLGQAVMLRLVVAMFVGNTANKESDWVALLLSPILSVGIAYICKGFIT